MIITFVQGIFSCVVLWLLWRYVRSYIVKSPLDNIRGPISDSYVQGHFRKVFNSEAWDFHEHLSEEYGSVVKLRGVLNEKLLLISDPLALHHIVVKDHHIYDEPPPLLEFNQLIFGPGIGASQGERHRRQRKMLMPAFSINHMRQMLPIFYQVTRKLRDAIDAQLNDGAQEIDVMNWMGRTALELIGQGGLGYSFDPLTEVRTDPLERAVKLFSPTLGAILDLRELLPLVSKIGSPAFRRFMLKFIPRPELHTMIWITDTFLKTSKEILYTKRAALEKGEEAVVQQIGEGKDIMSILLKANDKASVDDQLPEDELLAQMSTFIFAAMDTTSNALSRTLHLLAQHPEAQQKARDEVMAASAGGDLAYDDLVSLPYLDAVCRETLRLYSPVPLVSRKAYKAGVLPLSEPIRGVDGTMISEIEVPEGTDIFVGIMACNRSQKIWGEDALEWKPERWLTPLPESVGKAHVPGVYSNLMTFLGGSRSCIGFKFSQMEMKVVLATLLSSFQFELPNEKIVWNMSTIIYPSVGKPDTTSRMPLRVTKLNSAVSA